MILNISQVKQAFLDDRKSKALHDRREKEVRDARASTNARGASPTSPQLPSSSSNRSRAMPGSGQTLSGNTPPPPAYTPANEHDEESDSD